MPPFQTSDPSKVDFEPTQAERLTVKYIDDGLDRFGLVGEVRVTFEFHSICD